MHKNPFKLVRSEPNTSWTYRQGVQYLLNLNSQNICGEFENLEAAMEAARLKLVTDLEAVFFVCDAEGKVEGKVLDKLVQARKWAKSDAAAKKFVALIFLLSGVAYIQFLGFHLMPTPLYFVLVTLVWVWIICCVVMFPWDTKIILIFAVTLLIVMGCGLRHRIAGRRPNKTLSSVVANHVPLTRVAQLIRST